MELLNKIFCQHSWYIYSQASTTICWFGYGSAYKIYFPMNIMCLKCYKTYKIKVKYKSDAYHYDGEALMRYIIHNKRHYEPLWKLKRKMYDILKKHIKIENGVHKRHHLYDYIESICEDVRKHAKKIKPAELNK